MELKNTAPQLRLIYGGKSLPVIEGPATRLKLYDRFPRPDTARFVLMIATKLFLLWVVFQVAGRFR